MRRKLTDEQVIQARQRYREGCDCRSLATSMDVTFVAMYNALRGEKAYREIENPILATEMKRLRVRHGSLHHKAVLDEDTVQDIIRCLEAGESQRGVAEKFRISRSAINYISRGRSWNVKPLLLARNTKKNGSPGSKNPNAKLDERAVSHIKWYLGFGISQDALAMYFRVTKATINGISRGKSWKNVSPDPESPPLILSRDRGKPMRLRGERASLKGAAE